MTRVELLLVVFVVVGYAVMLLAIGVAVTFR